MSIFSRRSAKKKRLIFLGGTTAKNPWRDNFISELVKRGVPTDVLFNPVVANWDAEAQEREEAAKRDATHLVFYIASPMQEGNPLSAYSMVEATMALYDKPDRSVVVFDTTGMEGHPKKAMDQALKVLKARFPNEHIFGTSALATDWLAKAFR